ncbi:uncharacterized protein LOC132062193 [Lycium ferocissimum]|uniref:uncharacterized protein LOC132062193 n=1 Tax=Lycium ferocissimum TaxID=112874 RepID=UPI002815CE41|nr:uncharacterized protein LOC132062193 [Lycium ferocissimum]
MQGCWVLHPEHRPKKEEQKDGGEEDNNGKHKLKRNNQNIHGNLKDRPGEEGQATNQSADQRQKQKDQANKQPTDQRQKQVHKYGKPTNQAWNVVQNKKGANKHNATPQENKDARDANKTKEHTINNDKNEGTKNKFDALVNLEKEHELETSKTMVGSSEAVKETAKPWVEASFGKLQDKNNTNQSLDKKSTHDTSGKTPHNKEKRGSKEIINKENQCNKYAQEKDTDEDESTNIQSTNNKAKTQESSEAVQESFEIQDNDKMQPQDINADNVEMNVENKITDKELIKVQNSDNLSSIQQEEITKNREVQQLNVIPEKPPDGIGITDETYEMEGGTLVGTQTGEQYIEKVQSTNKGENKDRATGSNHQQEGKIKDNEREVADSISTNAPEEQSAEPGKVDDIGDDDEVEKSSESVTLANQDMRNVSPRQTAKAKRQATQNRGKSVPPKAIGGVLTRKAYAKGNSQ